MLDRFGFTPTESKSYQALLSLGPSTGYAVARATGIARANVYQALESLVRRGAARKAATIPSRYSAVSPAALLSELDRAFRRDLVALDDELRRVPQIAKTEAATIDAIEDAERLVADAARAVDEAQREVLAVAGPWSEALNAALDRASQRGLTIRSVALGEPAASGAIVRAVPESELRNYWGGLPVAVVVDRAHSVFGIIASDGSGNGIASAAPGVVPFLRHLLRRELAAGA